MTRTQWRRYQRSKKGIAARTNDIVVDAKEKLVETVIRPVKERLYFPPI
jgi:vacuolar-type H+-ATPase subunit E/Vma4